MKENVMDVLMFLFDNYLTWEDGVPQDEISLVSELEEAGFQVRAINKAFDWLGALADLKKTPAMMLPISEKTSRIYAAEEKRKLNVECRSFLHQLEDMKLVDPLMREIILDRAMAIEVAQLSLKQFKRIIGLVFLNSTKQEEAAVWIEELLYDEERGVAH